MEKSSKQLSGKYTVLGSGIGLIFGIVTSNLAIAIIFGAAIGLVVDSVVYSRTKSN